VLLFVFCGSGSLFGIATDYKLNDPEFESGPEAQPAFSTIGAGSFPGVKRPGRGADHPPPPGAEV
jgi:hypothetical protein